LDHASGGVVFTTLQKFTETSGPISQRANVVVLADEAHRSQYGFVEGGARWMREALPSATFVGFTGTPLELDDRNTVNVFGEYVDVYDVRQAVEDGATKPLYYESRIVRLAVDEPGLQLAEAELLSLAQADKSGVNGEPQIRVPMEALVGAPERLQRVASFVVDHWEARRAAIEGKAIVVTMSREIAAKLYDYIATLRPDWAADDDDQGFMKVVISGTDRESEVLGRHIRTKASRRRLAERFRDPADNFRLVIVCDMWLTGFDCPPAHTIYLDKPLASHNLMQAIARVNRVYGDKPGGLVVDLLGLADELADALAIYARAGGPGEPVRSAQGEAVPAMLEAFERLGDFFFDFDYESALAARPREVLPIYLSAADHVFGQLDGWRSFRNLVREFSTAFALAAPQPQTQELADHLAFFQRLASMISKRLEETVDEPSGGRGDVELAVR
jgi:type I restriction enzyme R subunit